MNATTTPNQHHRATDAAGHHAPRPVEPLCMVEILRGHHDTSNGGLTGRPRRCRSTPRTNWPVWQPPTPRWDGGCCGRKPTWR